jgi:hypothetical protein
MAAGPRGLALLTWIVVFTVICTVFLGLRYWAARITRRKFYVDDGFVIFAFVSLLLSGFRHQIV